jgi:hypothetical protein
MKVLILTVALLVSGCAHYDYMFNNRNLKEVAK